MTNIATNLNDYDRIAGVFEHYIRGARSGKGHEMEPAFHPDATLFGYIGVDLFAGPIQQLFDWNDENGPATDLRARITNIDLVDTVASVRLEVDNWSGNRFSEFFTLLKTDDRWQIINKVFHLHTVEDETGEPGYA